MRSMMGVINICENDSMMREMSRFRPLAAFPFAGRYRLIDFVLSNMINSGITNVAVLARGNYRSLMNHLRSGKEWDLARKKDGLFILPSLAKNAHSSESQSVLEDLEDYYNNLDYLKSSTQHNVLLSGCSMVCNLNFSQIYDFHQSKNADITIVYKEYPSIKESDFNDATLIETDEDGRVIDMEIAPSKPQNRKLCTKMFLLGRKLFIDIIDASVSRGKTSFIRDCILKNLSNLKIYGFAFDGYLARIHSYQSYFKHSMELLNPEIYHELFFQNGSVYTKVKDEPPTKYLKDCNVQNSLIANGSVLGGDIQNSVLFRGVKVQPGARIINSIIMQKAIIGKDVFLENVICDKDVRLTDGKSLRGEANHPIVIEKGALI